MSTTFGAYRYGAVDGPEMYIADSAETFSKACILAIRDPEGAAQVAEKGMAPVHGEVDLGRNSSPSVGSG